TPGKDADGSDVGQSWGPVEQAVAPTIVQSTQCPADCCTSTQPAYGCPGHTSSWPVQQSAPVQPPGPLLSQCTFTASSGTSRQSARMNRMKGRLRTSTSVPSLPASRRCPGEP